MDLLTPKDLVDERGFQFRYYCCSPAHSSLPTVIFLHGFPSDWNDWRFPVQHLKPLGYGLVVPDLLGAGKTSRPLDSKAYKKNPMAADIVQILDAEKLDKVVGVAHDWGCSLLSRLSMLYPERFIAFGWVSPSFLPPVVVKFDLDAVMATMKKLLGYECFSYWQFFAREDAADVIEKNVDSFIQLLYPRDPDSWRTYLALPGKTAEWMDGNMTPGFPDWLQPQDIEAIRRNVLDSGGIRSSLGWYLCQIESNDLDDNKKIPHEAWKIQRPSLFIAAKRDWICAEKLGKITMAEYGADVTTVEMDTGHWPHLECPEQFNRELTSWLLRL
ncbi:Alpha/Beta hydrolase protein [Amylostereum chailletii]|nr:Alpha/Beta hydrolase protein [Amylostereum chailletii]